MALAYSLGDTFKGDFKNITDYIVATANDTTTPVSGYAVPNQDGAFKRVAFVVVGKNKTGTSPTLTATLQGSLDGSNWFSVLDSAGNAVATSAIDISSTDGTAANYAVEAEDTNQEGITSFPPYLRIQVAVGGTGSPGGTYDVQFLAEKKSLKND